MLNSSLGHSYRCCTLGSRLGWGWPLAGGWCGRGDMAASPLQAQVGSVGGESSWKDTVYTHRPQFGLNNIPKILARRPINMSQLLCESRCSLFVHYDERYRIYLLPFFVSCPGRLIIRGTYYIHRCFFTVGVTSSRVLMTPRRFRTLIQL